MAFKATEQWPSDQRNPVLIAIAAWIFLFAKSVKLIGHFIRYPADILMLPVSILFGYVHGFLKMAGLFTLSEVSIKGFVVSGHEVNKLNRQLGAVVKAQIPMIDTV